MRDLTPKFVGLTGAPSVGKTTALSLFKELGASVLSSDQVVHDLYGTEVVRKEIIKRWGADVMEGGDEGGPVDRSAIARKVFSSPAERQWLEGLLWPLVKKEILLWKEQGLIEMPSTRAMVVEVPLLFESGLEGLFDVTVTVIAREEIRREREHQRQYQASQQRVKRQLSQSEKAATATYVIDNSGTVEELREEVELILSELNR